MNHIRKVLISAIGYPLILLGIVLIPLPGPGLLISLLGLFILSYEFDWAKKRKQQAQHELEKIIKKAKERADRVANYQQKNG